MTDDEIRALVGRLGDLHQVFLAQAKILAVGTAAVPALCDFLRATPPSVCAEPRVAAAECLGALGDEEARNALIGLLEQEPRRVADPAVRWAEGSVRSAAARALGRLREARAVPVLLRALERDRSIAAGEALADMEEALALPGLVACLEEPEKARVIDAIVRFGRRAVPPLVVALGAPRRVAGREPPTSVERRACAAEILGRLRASEALAGLIGALDDPSPAVRSEAALAAAAIAADPPPEVSERLVEALGDADVERQARAQEALARLGDRALAALLAAVRGASGDAERPTATARSAAVKLLALLWQPEIVPALAPLLADEDPRLRLTAVRALATQGASAAPVLAKALEDRFRPVREAARAALLDASVPRRPSAWRGR